MHHRVLIHRARAALAHSARARLVSPRPTAAFHTSRRIHADPPGEVTAPVVQESQTQTVPAQEEEEDAARPTFVKEEERPRRRKTTATRSSPAAADIPPEYASAHLWLPDSQPPPPTGAAHPPGLPPPHMMHDALTSLLLCLHPQTQHRSLFPGPGGQAQVEPTLALYCPIEGGDYVLDETIREVAKRAGAEVVVLDAAQLAAGSHGVFGRSAVGFRLPSNPLHVTSVTSVQSPNPPSAAYGPGEEDDELDAPFTPAASAPSPSRSLQRCISRNAPQTAMRKLFDEIVNLSPSLPDLDLPSTSTSAGSAGAPQSPVKPRIIYIRDFGLLAPTSAHWYPTLLSAVRARRARPLSRPSQPPPNPTVIVFGCLPPLLPQLHVTPTASAGGILSMLMGPSRSTGVVRVEGNEEEDAHERERRLSERLTAWEKNEPLWLSSELPAFGGSPPASTAGRSAMDQLGMLFGGGYVGLPARIGADSEYVSPPAGVEDGAVAGADARPAPPYFRALTILPSMRAPELETETRLARRREINMLAMRMAVGAVGGVLPDLELGDEELQQEDLWQEWGKKVEPWSVLRGVASRAVGGVVAEQVGAGTGGTSTLNPTPVPWTAVLDSWEAQRSSGAARKAWLDSARAASLLSEETPAPGTEESTEEKEDEVISRVRQAQDLEEGEQRLLGCIVDPSTMPTTFANVHLPAGTIDSIRTIVSLPLLHPQAFSQGILKQHAMTGALLFGVPGTGKTLVVRALAKESGARMLMIRPSDIFDMYVGQSEKLVRAVFTLARRLQPCIIFLDEIDAVFGARVSSRETGGGIAHRQVITEFMQEMDGLRTKEGGVIVIGATNRPFDLDDAVLRRLPRRLLVDLPGEKERVEILKILLRDEVLAPEVDIQGLAKRAEGFSGSDLKHLCVSAALNAVKETVELPWAVPRNDIKDTLALTMVPELQEASSIPLEEEKPSQEGASTPIAEGNEASVQEGTSAPIADLSPQIDGSDAPSASPTEPVSPPPPSITQRVLRPHHFAKALTEISASTSESLGTLSDLRKWNEEFGEGGTKRGRRKRWGAKFGFGIPDQTQGVRELGQVGGGEP